ncbi:MAG TPA: hypothetical protein VEG38_01670 [Acidimicrobiia bacterium]|nr:hypothetical protein [Acidimicrobiia bacterium]
MKVGAECPGCGTAVEIEPGRRTADLFCHRCDYPLFWVPPPDDYIPDTAEEIPDADTVLRRRPGAAGVRLPASVPCPACAELNRVLAELCIRCGSPMQPVSEPEPEVEVVVALPPPPPPEPEDLRWPWIAAALVAAIVMIVALALWLT